MVLVIQEICLMKKETDLEYRNGIMDSNSIVAFGKMIYSKAKEK
tara:strand:- start:353 stop:484 length:132 start_codon:yes stop_codon:yes gene_type:complete